MSHPFSIARRASSQAPVVWAVAVLLLAVLLVSMVQPARADGPRRLVEQISTVSTSISSSTAVVAASSGKRLCVRSMVLRSSAAGVVVFTDGDAGTTLANVYLGQDSTLVIDEHALREGFKTTSGNGLYAVLSGATLTATFRVALE